MQIFCICKNKDADQLRSNCAADQRLCFRNTDLSLVMRKPFFFFHMQKQRRRSAAQCNCAADQCLCFRNTDGTIPLLSKSEIFKLLAFFCGRKGLCWSWSETPRTVLRNPVLGVPDQVRHKRGCKSTGDGYRLGISDLRRREIVHRTIECADQLCGYCAAVSLFSHTNII